MTDTSTALSLRGETGARNDTPFPAHLDPEAIRQLYQPVRTRSWQVRRGGRRAAEQPEACDPDRSVAVPARQLLACRETPKFRGWARGDLTPRPCGHRN